MTFPKNVVLELTYKCNHRCLFCSCPWENKALGYRKGYELNIAEWKETIQILLDRGIEIFSISGGEAILKDDAKEIIQYIRTSLTDRQIDTEITLISNGLCLSEEWMKFFKKYNVHLSISIPGYDTFSQHTGVDNVEGVLNWFRLANALGLRTTANVTVTKLNLKELKKTIALALLNGAYDILLNRFLPGGRGITYMKDLMITTKEVNQMLEDAEDVLSIANRYGNIGTEIPLCSIDNPTHYKHLHIGYKCAAATGFFVVGPAGEIRTCNHSPKIVGHVFHPDIITDWTYWNKFAEDEIDVMVCNGCLGKTICSCGCREVAHLLSSKVDNPDPSILLTHNDLYK